MAGKCCLSVTRCFIAFILMLCVTSSPAYSQEVTATVRDPAVLELAKFMRSVFFDKIKTGNINPAPFNAKHPSFSNALHVEYFLEGRAVAEGYGISGNFKQSLDNAMNEIRIRGRLPQTLKPEDIMLSITFFGQAQEYAGRASLSKFLTHGVHGFYVQCEGKTRLIPNSRWITKNREQEKMVKLELGLIGCTLNDLKAGKAKLTRYETTHLVQVKNNAPLVRLTRGDIYIEQKDVTRKSVSTFLERTASWFSRNIDRTGNIEFAYILARNSHVNIVKLEHQWPAVRALGVAYQQTGKEVYKDMWWRASRFYLNKFLKKQEDKAIFLAKEESNIAMSGEAMMALKAIENSQFDDIYKSLVAALQDQRLSNASFRTWFVPATRNSDQDTYPGIVLRAMAQGFISGDMEQVPLQDVLDSVDFYVRWWYEHNQLLSFVPMYSKIFSLLYQELGEESYIDTLFEMNDVLMKCQLTSSRDNPEMVGRFYVRLCQQFGKPHASSTAAFVESLSHAYRVAVQLGENERASQYKRAMLLGMRSLMQLQVKEENTWYVREPEHALGGIRATVTDNNIYALSNANAIFAAEALLDLVKDGLLQF